VTTLATTHRSRCRAEWSNDAARSASFALETSSCLQILASGTTASRCLRTRGLNRPRYRDFVWRHFGINASPLPATLMACQSSLRWAYLELMGGANTVLTLVKVGDLWRVKIAWPNGTTKYFGKFGSEQEARRWIGAHGWLTKHVIEATEISRPWGSVSRRKSVSISTRQAESGEPASGRKGQD
jgi:hypothetical protein